jgi:hypothetical protein
MTRPGCINCGEPVSRTATLCRDCSGDRDRATYVQLPPRVMSWESWDYCNGCGRLRGRHEAGCRVRAA